MSRVRLAQFVFLGCILVTDLQWLIEDHNAAWLTWTILNWVRLATLCLLARSFAKDYATRAWCVVAAGWFLAKIPLETISGVVEVSTLRQYILLGLYIATSWLIIRKNDHP